MNFEIEVFIILKTNVYEISEEEKAPAIKIG